MVGKRSGWAVVLSGLAVLGATGAFNGALKHWALAVGFALVIVGVSLEVVVRVSVATQRATDMISLRRKLENGYLSDKWAVEPSDIDSVYAVAKRSGLKSDGYPRRGLLEERMTVNPNLVRLVYIDEPGKQNPVGYFMIYPLNSRASKAIREGHIHGGSEIHGRHIVTSWRKPSAIYVGSIAAVGGPRTWAAGATTLALRSFLEQYRQLTIFARPATVEGGRLMRHAGFVAIGGHSEVWQRLPVGQ